MNNVKTFETEIRPVFLAAMAGMSKDEKKFAAQALKLVQLLMPHVEAVEELKRTVREQASEARGEELDAQHGENIDSMRRQHELQLTALKRAHAHEVSHLEARCRLAFADGQDAVRRREGLLNGTGGLEASDAETNGDL